MRNSNDCIETKLTVWRDANAGAEKAAAARAKKSPHEAGIAETIPLRRCSGAGNVFFDEVGVLEPVEFDREAALDMTDHAAGGLAEGHGGTDVR